MKQGIKLASCGVQFQNQFRSCHSWSYPSPCVKARELKLLITQGLATEGEKKNRLSKETKLTFSERISPPVPHTQTLSVSPSLYLSLSLILCLSPLPRSLIPSLFQPLSPSLYQSFPQLLLPPPFFFFSSLRNTQH